ncbi:hypothetical protein [Streptomyces boninensis]|uniref:hypothetical protein n=1 Tax=Streptomyces boninensis TaxID=2039455 RepID=UPI003B212041
MTGTVNGGSQVRTYRGSVGLKVGIGALLSVIAGALAFFAVLLVRVAEAPFVFALPFAALAAVTLALMVGFVRSATIVEQDRITVRDAGTRSVAWRDITAIAVEENFIGGGKTAECIAVYTRDGRRLVLPNIAGIPTLSVQQEAQAIRATWERRRGEDWTPQPAAVEAGKERAAAGQRIEASIVGAMGCGYTAVRITVFGILVLGVIALASGKGGDLPEIPWWVFAAVIGGVAVLPLLVVLLAGLIRGKRR